MLINTFLIGQKVVFGKIYIYRKARFRPEKANYIVSAGSCGIRIGVVSFGAI